MAKTTIRRLAGGALVSTAIVTLGAAAPAAADPRGGQIVDVVCDDGNTYTMVAQAGQTWNAQLVSDSTSVFHLTRYTITYVVTSPDGTVTTFGPDTLVKGGTDRDHKGLLSCTYSFDLAFDDGTTVHISGPAVGWLTPSNP